MGDHKLLVTVIGLASAVSTAMLAAPLQQVPVFRSGIDLIEVDVVVTDRNGAPVRDLTSADFEILEDGRAQEVRTFALVDLPFSVSAREQPGNIESDVTTNALPDGRVYVLLLDAPSTAYPQSSFLNDYSYTMRVKQVAQQFVEIAMQPGDQVAVVHVQGTFADSQSFTTSRGLVEASIARYGRGRSGVDSLAGGSDTLTRNLDTYRAIEDLATRLGTIRGRRKAIVWIGGQIDIATERNPGTTAAAAATLRFAHRDAIRAAARNNVAIYPIDPAGATSELGNDELVRMAGLRAVAEETGGIALVNTSNFEAGINAIIRDLSAYYLLGYSPDRQHRAGTFHPVQVRVKRPGVTVRARRGYYAGEAAESTRTSSNTLPNGVSRAAAEALARPLATPGVQLDIVTTAFRLTGGEQSVLVAAHVRGESLRLDSGASLAIAFQVFDIEGHVVTGAYRVFGLDLQLPTRSLVAVNGLAFLERLTLRPGRYELRIVAEQPGIALGSVIAPIHVPEIDDRLGMSGLVLATQPASTVRLTTDEKLRHSLGAEPTVKRTFKSTGSLVAFAEVYMRTSTELAVLASITTATGTEMARSTASPTEGRSGPSDDGVSRGYRAAFDLTTLGPGSYVLTMEARTDGERAAAATRRVAFTIAE